MYKICCICKNVVVVVVVVAALVVVVVIASTFFSHKNGDTSLIKENSLPLGRERDTEGGKSTLRGFCCSFGSLYFHFAHRKITELYHAADK